MKTILSKNKENKEVTPLCSPHEPTATKPTTNLYCTGKQDNATCAEALDDWMHTPRQFFTVFRFFSQGVIDCRMLACWRQTAMDGFQGFNDIGRASNGWRDL